MKVQPGSMDSSFSAPVAEFDPDDVFAPAFLLALACWPSDSRGRGEALVTWAAQINAISEIIGFTETKMEALIETSAAEAAAAMGLTPETLLTLPHAREIAAAVRGIPTDMQRLVKTGLFDKGGGWLSMGSAAHQGRVGEKFAAASRGGMVAGYIILFCAQIKEHHRQITGGYNRAIYMVEKLHDLGLIPAGGDRQRKEAWIEWRGVGHVWAAILLARQAETSGGAATGGCIPGPDLRRTLRWAQWFREFAVTHRAVGARYPLVAPHEAVDLRTGVGALKPPLQPLRGPALRFATEYKAPRPSQ